MNDDRNVFVGIKEKTTEEDFAKLAMAIQEENIQFKKYLDETHNKLSSDVSEYIFSSEDPKTRLKNFKKTIKDLENVVEMDKIIIRLIK